MDENKTFAFNFAIGAAPTSGSDPLAEEKVAGDGKGEGVKGKEEEGASALGRGKVVALPAEEVEVAYRQIDIDAEHMEPVRINEGLTLYKGSVDTDAVADMLGDERVSSHDLIPGVYEGGFKLWEGAIDLCAYLCDTYKLTAMLSTIDVCPELQGKKVLELGCGHGLPGITMMVAGADVHFQDYNKEVLRELTVVNALANVQRLPVGRPRPSMRFFAGDWSHMGEFLSARGLGGHYNIILTSESIYDLESQYRLLECIKQVLEPPHGIALVASKSYYFGVGGGTKTFYELVKEDGIFEITSVFRVEDASSGNVREIIKLSFPSSIAPSFL